ncbi:unnamed protein product [Adineta steineri]|uniref:C2H2-type domain-containing protein n=1 Tax=Adineta steineri TaxID=433720 RepID=A0A819EK82_9BILA|nr:unnamed protein product [Adineta steineri]
MSLFICPLCSTNREFSTFLKLFRHITVFHQNEPRFEITCNLDVSCGVSYRTYSAYKSHVYRHHANHLHATQEITTNSNIISNNNLQHNNQDFIGENDDPHVFEDHVESDLLNSEDEEDNHYTTLLPSNNNREKNLREEFFLPKNTTNAISTYIVTLINHLEVLLEEKAFVNQSDILSSTQTSNEMVVDLQTVKKTMSEISNEIQNTTRNEYQFIKNCQKYFDYHAPEDIPISTDHEQLEHGYYIPIHKTLSSVLCSKDFSIQIIESIQQQKIAVEKDDDLMLSFRDSTFGCRIDDDSLMIQLYMDDIGLTNPIGAKKDQHKMAMIYFSLEDTPEQYRSQLDCIYLVGLCPTSILKEVTESTDVTESNESTESTESNEVTESTDVTESTESNESTESTESNEVTESTDVTESNESTDVTDVPESTDVTEFTESKDVTESKDFTGSKEVNEVNQWNE